MNEVVGRWSFALMLYTQVTCSLFGQTCIAVSTCLRGPWYLLPGAVLRGGIVIRTKCVVYKYGYIWIFEPLLGSDYHDRP